DTGVGIAEALRQRLFTPFSQHDASTTRKFGGTGLGLAISQQLAQMLGGSLEAPRPDPGAARGAVFELLLPIPEGAAMLSGPEPDAPPASVVAATAKIRLSGRILLAEDGVDNQRLLQHVLRTAGATVLLAENGTEAVAAARAADPPFDLVLMDMQMPEMDGYEATVALRQAGVDTPIVALTAHAMAGDRERCLAAGCNDYLTKPIDRATLLGTCGHWMLAQRRAA
ncbi:MAG: response regulator, partial [Phycisphaerales bacterium]|nr:response regulator [Phycisphaerales bacterium]